MKSTLADIRQLFNAKDIAYATKIENLTSGQIGVFAEDSDTSIAASIRFATLPDKFRIVANVGGKLYFSFDTIEKARMRHNSFKAYQAEAVNIWKVQIDELACECIKTVGLDIHLSEAGLIQQDGLTWTHRDNYYELSPDELVNMCDCEGEGKAIYQNHLFTEALFNRIQANQSPYYKAVVKDETGTVYATAAAIRSFIETNKSNNMGDGGTGFEYSEKLVLFIEGIAQASVGYNDLEVNHVTPRGVKLTPILRVNGRAIPFTQEQALVFEIGEGADIRAEEWENMNFYTPLNFYPELTDGIAVKGLKYQFENGKKYDGVAFEFTTEKVDTNSGESRLFGVFLGAETGTAESTELRGIFVPA